MEQGPKFKTRSSSYPSGGMRVDNHAFWAGGPSKESPLPMTSKMKQESSAEGAGNVTKYEDTTEAIRAEQMESQKKVKAHPMKQPGYRN